VPQGATCVGLDILVNDKAADILDVRAAALSCPRIIRGTFPPLSEKPEREKTDATSPLMRKAGNPA
jgi:hypothetical protein